jgi:outer membrane protein assembly factor BamB
VERARARAVGRGRDPRGADALSGAQSRYNYLIAINPDLTGKWAASLRGHPDDGCNDGSVVGTSPEAFFVTQLDPSLSVEVQNTNTLSCSRNPDGSVTCVDDGSHPHSFEWCVNAPAVDKQGVVYANSEDGFLYAIRQGGMLKQKIFQQLNLGAAYTPASLGSDGKIYSQNAGHMFVVGQ